MDTAHPALTTADQDTPKEEQPECTQPAGAALRPMDQSVGPNYSDDSSQ
jgi:hypothetical protein